MERSRRSSRKRYDRDAESESSEDTQPTVDLSVLTTESLKKYKRIYKLRTRTNNAGKSEILNAVSRHFMSMPCPDEDVTIESFIYNIKHGHP